MLRRIINGLKVLIKGGFIHILTGNILNKAIAMLSSIIIARMIDKAEYAYLSYADNLYSYLTLLTGLGFSSALLKYCGVKNDLGRDKAYLIFALTRGAIFELSVSFTLCFAVMFIDIPFTQARWYMWLLCLYPPLNHLFSVFAMYIRTQFENRRYALSGVIQSIVVCLLSVMLVKLTGSVGIVIARYFAVIIVVVFLGLYVHRRFRGVIRTKLTHDEVRSFMSMGLSLMTANLFSGMMPINETFLVNNIIKDAVVTANFRIAGIFPSMLLLFASAITVYYFPIVSQLKNWIVIRRAVLRIGLLSFLFLLSVAIIGCLFTPLAIKTLYGEKYLDAIPMTYLLWAMRAMNCCIRIIPMNLLPAIGETRFNAWVAFISCVIQIGVDYYMISKYGMYGIIWGTILVYGISGATYWIHILRVCAKNIRLEVGE